MEQWRYGWEVFLCLPVLVWVFLCSYLSFCVCLRLSMSLYVDPCLSTFGYVNLHCLCLSESMFMFVHVYMHVCCCLSVSVFFFHSVPLCLCWYVSLSICGSLWLSVSFSICLSYFADCLLVNCFAPIYSLCLFFNPSVTLMYNKG